MDDFQMSGIVLSFTDKLKIFVRYMIPLFPRFLRWRLDIPSGPIALEALLFLIASFVLSWVSWMLSSSVFLCMSL